jgi:hypothetical protein
MVNQNMSDKKFSEIINTYRSKGTVLVSFQDKLNPLDNKNFEKLVEYCEKVEKEFIKVGDAGEINNLMVGRFMTDKLKPEIVKNPYSKNVIKILQNDEFKEIIKNTLNLKEDFYLRRIQYNQINKGNFVGYHLDTDSNPDYLAACVIQLGDNFKGGIYRVFQPDASYNDFIPTKGSFIISNCNYPHEVTRVEEGERKSLVFFISSHSNLNKRYNK